MSRPMRWLLLTACALAWSVVPAVDVRYRVTFDATWTAESHPQDYPSSAHFSCPVGAVHTADAVFWQQGELASNGIEVMAETGGTGPLSNEIAAAAALGHASPEAIYADFIFSPGTTSAEFVATPQFSKFTLVTMIAPSPDWFAGTSGLELRVNGRWRDNMVIDLVAYDAGTDSGTTFLSSNFDTNPAAPISLIVTPPLATDGYAPPIGTYTLVILAVDGRPPYDDADGDGLTNLREAELGSDPLSSDSDGDAVPDGADNCLLAANAAQLDADVDGVGDVCDNCPATSNPTQADGNGDGNGDRCDLGDGLLLFTSMARDSQAWQHDTLYDAFNLYRGDLQVLRAGGAYAQDPAAANVERLCGLPAAAAADGYAPPPGEAVFFLVTGVAGGVESSLGTDGGGSARPNAHPCP